MSGARAYGPFPTCWDAEVLHDLSRSDSETLSLSALLALAGPDDLARWGRADFGYGDPRGALWLRAAIARRHAALGPDDVVCCAGAQEAVACVTTALLERGDHAIVVLPIYPPSEQAVTRICAASGVPLEARSWQLDVDRLEAAIRPNTKLVLTNFPNSPTGIALDPDTLGRLVALCRHHGLWLVNDEIYGHTDASAWSKALPAVADAYERGISINGLSKGFGLPGLRVGWLASRDAGVIARAMQSKNAVSSCLSAASEILAHIALAAEEPILARTRAIASRNRDRLRRLTRLCPEILEEGTGSNLALAFPRYLGPGTVEAFVERLALQAGFRILPASLWHSPLGTISDRHVRIGLGHEQNGAGLERLAGILASDRMNEPALAMT